MKSWGIELRVFFISLMPVTVIALLLVAYFVTARIAELSQSLNERGLAIARQMAPASEYGLFSGNTEILQALTRAALREADVEAVRILDSSGTVLASSRQGSLEAGIARQHSQTPDLLFSAPVFQSQIDIGNNIDPSSTAKTPARTLGTIEVELGTARTEAQKNRFIRNAIYITLFGLIFTALLAASIGRSVTRPILALTAAVKELERGNLDVRVHTGATAELATLEKGFNQMASAQQSAQDTLTAEVAAVTRQLETRAGEESRALTQQKEMAEQARAEAEAANRSKSRFLASASHDLRQPLHALGLFAAALSEKHFDPDTRALVANIAASVRSLESLFNALLDISRLDAGIIAPHVRHFALQPLFERIATDYTPQALEQGLRLRVAKTRAVVFSDPILLEQMLRNLVSNAIRYTYKNGVLLGARRSGGAQLRVGCWDTGIGIDKSHHSEIFTEFFQLGNPERDRAKGLGLGLAIVQRLARILKYEIHVVSTPGVGSCFSFDVPLGNPALLSNTKAHPATRFDDARVLVIDDERSVLDSTCALLQGWGCKPVAADSLAAAMDVLAGGSPALILADYRLRNNETGVAAINVLRQTFGASIPAVLITGDTLGQHDVGVGPYYTLHKPVSPAKLRALMKSLLK